MKRFLVFAAIVANTLYLLQITAAQPVQNIDSHWVVSRLQEQLRTELRGALADAGLDTPEHHAAIDALLPTIARERVRVPSNVDLKVLTGFSSDAQVKYHPLWEWLGIQTRIARVSGFDNVPLATPMMPQFHTLPPPGLLRLMIVLRMDFGATNDADRTPHFNERAAEQQRKARESTLIHAGDHIDEYAAWIDEALAGAEADPRFAGENVRLIATMIERAFDHNVSGTVMVAAAERFNKRDADPWLRAYFLGKAQSCKAWDDRGSQFYTALTEQQRGLLQRGLESAFKNLAAAHALAPKRPYAAGELISVALGSSNPSHLTPEYWSEQARRADPSYEHAFSAMRFVVLPRWGGSAADVLALLKQMADAEDGHSSIGVRAIGLYDDVLEDDPNYLQIPGFAASVVECLRPYFHANDPGVSTDEAKSLALYVAHRAKEPQLALSVFADGPMNYVPPTLESRRITPGEVEAWAYNAHPEFGADLRQLRVISADGLTSAQREAAERLYRADAPVYIHDVADRTLSIDTLRREFDAGKEITLLIPGGAPVWIPLDPRIATFDPIKGTIQMRVVYPEPIQGKGGIRCAVPLGDRFTLSARVRFTAPAKAPTYNIASAGFMIAKGPPDAPIGVASIKLAEETARTTLKQPNSTNRPDGSPYFLRLEADEKGMTLSLDNTVVDRTTKNEKDRCTWLMLWTNYSLDTTVVEFSDIRVLRRTDPRPVTP